MIFACDDLERLASIVAHGWRESSGADWSVPAGTLDWSCTATADHAVDTVLAPALFLASRKTDEYPAGGWSMGEPASATQLADGLDMVTRILVAVVRDADPSVRAVIWRRPSVETRPPADFVPRAGLELILHAHDVASGLGIDFRPPAEICERLRGHTVDWPFWDVVPGWSKPSLAGDPWQDLLRSSGRG